MDDNRRIIIDLFENKKSGSKRTKEYIHFQTIIDVIAAIKDV